MGAPSPFRAKQSPGVVGYDYGSLQPAVVETIRSTADQCRQDFKKKNTLADLIRHGDSLGFVKDVLLRH